VTEVANVGAGREREKKLRIFVQYAAARGTTRHHRWGAWNHAPPPVGRVGRRAATVHAVPEGLPSTVMEF